jgi:DNA-directed RNA polymerase specialized sigma24 family protein
MVTLEEASALAKVPPDIIYCRINAGSIHSAETLEGPILICLNSISTKESEVVPSDTNPSASLGNDGKYEERKSQAEINWRIQTQIHLQPHNKEWRLTERALNKLLSLFDTNPDRAGEKYENIRRKLIRFFEYRGCASPADRTDETIDRVTRKVDEGVPLLAEDISKYFYGVARNVQREYWHCPEREFTMLECIPHLEHYSRAVASSDKVETERLELEKRLQCLEEYIQQLSPESRELILQYYQGNKRVRIENRKILADRLGIPVSTLRIRAHRIREKLRGHMASFE